MRKADYSYRAWLYQGLEINETGKTNVEMY